jgi:hypothetical protein
MTLFPGMSMLLLDDGSARESSVGYPSVRLVDANFVKFSCRL